MSAKGGYCQTDMVATGTARGPAHKRSAARMTGGEDRRSVPTGHRSPNRADTLPCFDYILFPAVSPVASLGTGGCCPLEDYD